MSDVRKYMLEPAILPWAVVRAWDAPPGIYDTGEPYARRLVMVWGDAGNRQMVVNVKRDANQGMVPTGEPRSIRQMDSETRLLFLWPLCLTDGLPGAHGPDVASYIARVEQGGAG